MSAPTEDTRSACDEWLKAHYAWQRSTKELAAFVQAQRDEATREALEKAEYEITSLRAQVETLHQRVDQRNREAETLTRERDEARVAHLTEETRAGAMGLAAAHAEAREKAALAEVERLKATIAEEKRCLDPECRWVQYGPHTHKPV